MAESLGARKNDQWMAVCITPSIDYTPIGPLRVPVPYQVVSDLSQSQGTLSQIRFNSDPIYLLDQSSQPLCTGDENGTGGGIFSGTFCGEVKPVLGSSTVKIDGKAILRHGDPCTMNKKNCTGKYVSAPPPLDDDVTPPPSVFVTIQLSQEYLCPDHPVAIKAIGTPEGGVYEWTHSKNCQLLDASGRPSRSGNQLNVKRVDDRDKIIRDTNVQISVVYKHPAGEAQDSQSPKINDDLPLLVKWHMLTGSYAEHISHDANNPPTEHVDFNNQRFALVVIPGMNMNPNAPYRGSTFSHIGRPTRSGTYSELEDMQKACNYTFHVNQSVLINNWTHGKFLLGDIAQSTNMEAAKTIDSLVQATAQAILQGLKEKGEVYVVAHSQGTTIFDTAMPLVMSRTTPEQRKKIYYQGFGSETFIHNYKYGLGYARNVLNAGDPIPYAGTTAKGITTTLKMLTEGRNYALGEAIVETVKSRGENWETIDSQVPWRNISRCLLNHPTTDRHNFIENYWAYVKIPSAGVGDKIPKGETGVPDTLQMRVGNKEELTKEVRDAKLLARKWAKASSGFKVVGEKRALQSRSQVKKNQEVIISCFIDGTGSNASARSNIRLMYESLVFHGGNRDKHFLVFPEYFAGPGAGTYDYAGAVLGAHSMRIANEAYDRIVKQYLSLTEDEYSKPKIDIYGFSRGAAIANEVAWMIDTRGIDPHDGSPPVVPPHGAKVRFLGLFETVHSMGLPGPNTSDKWHNSHFAPNVEHCAHAFAGNENRVYFEPSILERIPGTGSKPIELIFPGVHSDVGGHRDNNPFIMTLTRSWMAEQATKAGVPYLKQLVLSEAEKELIIKDPDKIKPGPEGYPDEKFIISGNPFYWEHERVQMANQFAQNSVGKGLDAVLRVASQAPGGEMVVPTRLLFRPGIDTFARQPRKLHQRREFERYGIHWLIPASRSFTDNENVLPSKKPAFKSKEVINFQA